MWADNGVPQDIENEFALRGEIAILNPCVTCSRQAGGTSTLIAALFLERETEGSA